MWEGIEARLDENEREGSNPLRGTFLDILRSSGLQPGAGLNKKMVSLEFGAGERIVWGIEGSARTFYLHPKWGELLRNEGFEFIEKPFDPGEGNGGGRHTGLNNSWAFQRNPCLVVKIENEEVLRRLIAVLLPTENTLMLDPAAVTRWIERLRHFFPTLDRFDQSDTHFDGAERIYKLEIGNTLKVAIQQAASHDELAYAIHTALSSSNLLPWRTYWPMSPKGDANREQLWPALASLVDAALGEADGHALALEAFVEAWVAAVPNGKPDPARQIAEFLFFHLNPNNGIYIRHSVRQDLWLEAVGSRFPNHSSMAAIYRDEWRFMDAVRRAFVDRGLAPRDMIDVQSALWIAHHYKGDDEMALSREEIEGAMDAFDRYRQAGEHAAIFEAFGEPRDYWVRSTRARPNRVYPSKPIIGFLRGKTQLNGGWGQKADAAAQLHNSGFIIVNANDDPVPPPERYEHLLAEADRIRLCARNYYIEPAREVGSLTISISAGDLSQNLGLSNVFPAICSALGGDKFQKLANVPKPSHTIPNPSSTTVFTYQLNPAQGAQSMSNEAKTSAPVTTNLILYGPPGTGKTYNTALEAVKLCDGTADHPPTIEGRAALMARYNELVAQERIGFVTFHQNYGYEDFVEGLRPSIYGDDGEPLQSGFRLAPEAGIFTKMAERAEALRSARDEGYDFSGKRFFKMSLGEVANPEDDYLFEEAIEGGFVHMGDDGGMDWCEPRFTTKEAMIDGYADRHPELPRQHPNNGIIEFPFRLRVRARVGDIVIISKGNLLFRAIGEVTGEYHQVERENDNYTMRRAVKWLWIDREGVSHDVIYGKRFSQRTIYEFTDAELKLDAIRGLIEAGRSGPEEGPSKPFVLIIDEINRANVSKVFGELITLLEPDKRAGMDNALSVTLPYSKRQFSVPANLHIVGTMNTADRSIALLDTALRRRFNFREMAPDPSLLADASKRTGIDLVRTLTTINQRIEYLIDREHRIGHAFLISCKTPEQVHASMRDKVIPLLQEYFFDDWSRIHAVLGDGFIGEYKLDPPPGVEGDQVSSWSVLEPFQSDAFERLTGKVVNKPEDPEQ